MSIQVHRHMTTYFYQPCIASTAAAWRRLVHAESRITGETLNLATVIISLLRSITTQSLRTVDGATE